MNKIIKQLPCDNYAVLILDSSPPSCWNTKTVVVDGVAYESEIVYDLENAIAVPAKGDFIGKTVEFKTA